MQPSTHCFNDEPGLDIARRRWPHRHQAGRRRRCTFPGRRRGALVHPGRRATPHGPPVYLPPEEEITPANSARQGRGPRLPPRFRAARGLPILGLYLTPDIATETGDYYAALPEQAPHRHCRGRPGRGSRRHRRLRSAAQARRRLLRPASRRALRLPAVFVGGSRGRAAQDSGRRGPELGRASQSTTRWTAERPQRHRDAAGRARRRSWFANTDGNSWVQENGVVGMLAFARYYADLPMRCRATLELVFSSAHDAFRNDGADHYASLDRRRRHVLRLRVTIAHLKRARSACGEGADQHLEFTGLADPPVGPATARPCGSGGRGDEEAGPASHRGPQGPCGPEPGPRPDDLLDGGARQLLPPEPGADLAMISGPWSLYDPVFGGRRSTSADAIADARRRRHDPHPRQASPGRRSPATIQH